MTECFLSIFSYSVVSVVPGGAASVAEIKAGDIITHIDDEVGAASNLC